MKLLLENWRKYIKEAELKHSESAEEQIWDAVDVAYKNDRNDELDIEIPTEEIFYFDNKKIKNGAAILYLVHFGEMDLEKMPFVQKNWNSGTGIKDELLQNILTEPLNIVLSIDKSDPALGAIGFRRIKDEPTLNLIINPWNSDSPDQLRSTIRHELQHVTQRLNGYALEYGELLFNANGDTSKLEKIAFGGIEKEFGIGKQKTGLRQISKQRAREQGISDDELFRRYLGDDFEYETLMSDMLDDLVRWLYKNEFIRKPNLKVAAFKDKYPDVLNEETNNLEARKQLQHMAKQINVKPIELVKDFKKSPSIHQLAVKFTKHILTNDQDLSKFADDVNMAGYVKAVKTLLKLRPKEFASDFTKNLEIRLRKEAGLK